MDDLLDKVKSELAYVDAIVADFAIPFLNRAVDVPAPYIPTQARAELKSVIAVTGGLPKRSDPASHVGQLYGYALLLQSVLDALESLGSADSTAEQKRSCEWGSD